MVKFIRKNLCLAVIFITAIFLNTNSGKLFAAGDLGGEIFYQCIGGSNYTVYVNYYQGGGLILFNNSITVTDGKTTKSYSVTKGNATCMSPYSGTGVCNRCQNTLCVNPIYANITTYYANVDMSYFNGCNLTISCRFCCWNGAITTGAANDGNYIECKLNRCHTEHSSPFFQQAPVFWANAYHNFDNFQTAVSANKKDSTVYRLVPTFIGHDTPVIYNKNYDFDHPIIYSGSDINDPKPNGFHYDLHTGELAFKPVQLETTVLNLEADEYTKDTSGKYYLSGTTMRNTELYAAVLNSSTLNPIIKGINGRNYDTIVTCSNVTLKFTIKTFDQSTKDTLTMGTSLNETSGDVSFSKAQLPEVTFTWTPTNADISKKPYHLVITGTDNARPAPDVISKEFLIYVTDSMPAANVTYIDSGCARFYFMPPADTSKGLTYKWYINNQFYSTNKTIAYTFPHNINNNVVDLMLTDKQGCQRHYYDNLTITNLPNVALSKNTELCNGGQTMLSASGAKSYKWFPPYGLSSDTGANPIASPKITTQYLIKSTDKKGCVSIDSLSVIIDNFRIPINLDTTICFGSMSALDAYIPRAKSYKWTNRSNDILSTTSILNIKIVSDTAVSLTIVDSFGCIKTFSGTIHSDKPIAHAGPEVSICYRDSIQLHASGGTKYFWGPAQGLANHFISNPFVRPPHTENFMVTVSDSFGCSSKDSVTVIVSNINPVVKLGTTICFGDSVSLFASGGTYYSWVPASGLDNPNIATPVANPSKTTEYVANVRDSLGGCTRKDSILIMVGPEIQIDLGPDQSVCNKTTIHLGNDSTPGYLYNWYSQPVGFHSNNAKEIISPLATTTYYLLVTDPILGCQASDSVKITLNPIRAKFTGPFKICNNDTAYYLTKTNDPTHTYAWALKGGHSIFLSKNHIYVSWDSIGNNEIKLVETNAASCKDSTTQIVKTSAHLASHITTNHDPCLGNIITFSDSGVNAVSFMWKLGDSSISSLPTLTHLYKNSGIYHVRLAASNGLCTTYDSTLITVHKPLALAPIIAHKGFRQFLFENNDSSVNINPNWNTGDTNILKYNTITHTYKNNGTYNIEFIYNDPWNCGGVFDTSIIVNDSIIIPPPHYNDSVSISQNPFKDHIDIKYTLGEQGAVSAIIYDAIGHRFAEYTLGVQNPGKHVFTFQTSFLHLSQGIYFLKFINGNKATIFKILKVG